MSFKLIEIQKPSPPGVLVIKARSRGSLTILLISLPIGIFAFLFFYIIKIFSIVDFICIFINYYTLL